jgi:Protein of unknown function (DUF3379)
MTDCDRCRAAIAADPDTGCEREHLAQCPACRAWQADMRDLDARLARALAVAVPRLQLPDLDALPDNVATLERPPGGQRASSLRWLALAASLVVAAFVGIRLMNADTPATALGDEVLAHIDHEAFSLAVTDRSVGAERLARVVPANVAVLPPDMPLVTYAQSCEINGHSVPHLVVQGEHGPVTILLMEHEKVDAPQHIGDGVLSGVILPVGGGSIAIVGQEAGDLEAVEKTMKNAVAWRT